MKRMSLEETQECCLGVLEAFDSFCDAHELSYYLIGGSALGAVRHQGIIPWDDDIDVGMSRDDYDRFCENYLDTDQFELLALGKTPGYFSPCAKLCDRTTWFDEPESKYTKMGVFIDVFPLDCICASPIKIKGMLIMKKLYSHSFVVNLQAGRFAEESFPKKIIRKLMSLSLSRFEPITVSSWITDLVASPHPTKKMMNIWGSWGEREIMEASWLGEGCFKPFSGMKCRIPSEWDKYLHTLYGDYMTPPDGSPRYHGQAYRIDASERV